MKNGSAQQFFLDFPVRKIKFRIAGFRLLSEGGGNYARIWFAPWGFAQEWDDTGLGDYSNRQDEAWKMDYLFELAEEYSINLLLYLINHGQFSTKVNPEWDGNPYSAANGGMLENPWEFLMDEEAKKLFKRKLRYTIARWGYSSELFAWELWNEVNLADNMAQEETLVPWIEEMAGFIRETDIHDHLIGNSFNISVDGSSPFWKDLDFIQRHEYNRSDWAVAVSRGTAKILPSAGKPFFYGEFGLGGDTIDSDAVHFNNGIWASLMSGAAGTAMLWWWDSYVERNELYDTFYGFSCFLENTEQSLPEMTPVETQYGPGYELYGLSGKNISLFWIKNSRYTYQGYPDLQFEFGKDNAFFEKTEGLKAVIPIDEEDIFAIEFRYTRSGEIIKTVKTGLNKNSAVDVPGFTGDMAIKVIREKE